MGMASVMQRGSSLPTIPAVMDRRLGGGAAREQRCVQRRRAKAPPFAGNWKPECVWLDVAEL